MGAGPCQPLEMQVGDVYTEVWGVAAAIASFWNPETTAREREWDSDQKAS